MEPQSLLSFLGVSILLTLMPGPDNIFVLLESLSHGSRNGILVSVGLVTGVLVHTTIAATGLSLVIQESDVLFQVIKYSGALYLLYLAYSAYKEQSPKLDFQAQETSKRSTFQLIRKGFVMNVLNPKVSLFFIAFLSQFVSKDGLHVSAQMVVLGLVFMVQALGIFSLFALVAAKLSSYMRSPNFWKATKVVKVATFCILALFLALSDK